MNRLLKHSALLPVVAFLSGCATQHQTATSTWYYCDWMANAPYAPVFKMRDTESSLGPYAKCKTLADIAEAAANELQLNYELEKVTDINDIMAFGIMMTPALAVDGDVKVVGKVPTIEKIKELLKG